MSAFTRTWELAPAIIDYVASRLGVARNQACTLLKDALQDGSTRAHGLIVGVGEIDLTRSFWRFAEINPDGSAINLSLLQNLAWFEINVDDVLNVWPPRPTPAAPTAETSPEAGTARLPRKAVRKGDLEPFLVSGNYASEAAAMAAATAHFGDRLVNRTLLRGIRKKHGLSGKVGRPRTRREIPAGILMRDDDGGIS
jgi:hypothetical protein